MTWSSPNKVALRRTDGMRSRQLRVQSLFVDLVLVRLRDRLAFLHRTVPSGLGDLG